MNTQRNVSRSRVLIPPLPGALALIAGLMLLGLAFAQTSVRVAQPAPAFAWKEANGKTIKLTDFENKALIICFFGTGDEPSRKQVRILNDLLGEHGETNLAILALAIDQTNPAPLKVYQQKEHLHFTPHVADYDTIQAFGGLSSIPASFVIDKNQNIIDKFVGVTETNVFDVDVKAILKQ